MGVHPEAPALGHVDQGGYLPLKLVRNPEVLHSAAAVTHQVVVVPGERLVKLEARPVVAGVHPSDSPHVHQLGEVPVGRALGQTSPTIYDQDLTEGDRSTGVSQNLNHGKAGPAVAHPGGPETPSHGYVQVINYPVVVTPSE